MYFLQGLIFSVLSRRPLDNNEKKTNCFSRRALRYTYNGLDFSRFLVTTRYSRPYRLPPPPTQVFALFIRKMFFEYAAREVCNNVPATPVTCRASEERVRHEPAVLGRRRGGGGARVFRVIVHNNGLVALCDSRTYTSRGKVRDWP